jgi:beta-glucosidase
MTTFPEGFLWGASTAGHQVEGGNVNADLWPLEWAEDTLFVEPSLDACDHYHRYPEDIATLAELGLTAYRFSVEWSRVEPEPGAFSNAALDHYRRMVGTCLEHGVTPVVTYTHFTTPRWFADAGGWTQPEAPERFGRYAERVTAHLGEVLPWAATLNEPNVMELLRQTGVIPMGVGDGEPGESRMGLLGGAVEQMAAIHRAGREAIRSGPGDTKVGWTLALIDLQPAEDGEERWQEAQARAELDWLEVSREDDFVGVQTYSRQRIGSEGQLPVPDGVPTMQTGWEVYPEALEHTVRLAAEHAGVPVLVTENGMATDDDQARIAYTRAALQGLGRAVDDGVDVRGYLHWTLLDNFEWMAGYSKTFGLIAFDRETFERTVKPSARWLGEVARANAIESDE